MLEDAAQAALTCAGGMRSAGSFMWPQVPIIHMYYRMTQLARAFALNAALSGPAYIFTILVCRCMSLLSSANCCKGVWPIRAEGPVPSSHTMARLMCLQAVAPSFTMKAVKLSAQLMHLTVVPYNCLHMWRDAM